MGLRRGWIPCVCSKISVGRDDIMSSLAEIDLKRKVKDTRKIIVASFHMGVREKTARLQEA